MAEIIAKVVRDGCEQTIRIPAELGFAADTVTIEKQGDSLVVRPKPDTGWESFLADESLVLPEDFDTGDDPAPPDRPDP